MSIDKKAFESALKAVDCGQPTLTNSYRWQELKKFTAAYEAAKAPDQPVHISGEAELEAITVGSLIEQLQKIPLDYSVHINVLGKVVCGITGAEDIGGDYFSQVFLTNFDHDPDIVNNLKSPKRESGEPFLHNRADGVNGHYAIARIKGDGVTHEYWARHGWGTFGDVFRLGNPTTRIEGGSK